MGRSSRGSAHIHSPSRQHPGMLAEREETLLRPPAQQELCSDGKWVVGLWEQRVPSAGWSPAIECQILNFGSGQEAVNEADNCLAVSDRESRVSGQGGGWAAGLCFREKYFFRICLCRHSGAFLNHMGLAPGEGGLAVILHLFSISADSAEICIGIKDGKGQRIDFLAFGLQDKHSKLNHSLEFFWWYEWREEGASSWQ